MGALTPPTATGSLKQQDGFDFALNEVFCEHVQERLVVQIYLNVNAQLFTNRFRSRLKQVVLFGEYSFYRTTFPQLVSHTVFYKLWKAPKPRPGKHIVNRLDMFDYYLAHR